MPEPRTENEVARQSRREQAMGKKAQKEKGAARNEAQDEFTARAMTHAAGVCCGQASPVNSPRTSGTIVISVEESAKRLGVLRRCAAFSIVCRKHSMACDRKGEVEHYAND